MFNMNSDNRAIREYVWSTGPDGLVRVVDFVLATIQQQFPTVPMILEEWDRDGDRSPTMWGMKRDGWRYMHQHADRLFALLKYESRDYHDPSGAIDTMLEVPGLAIVKSAFVAQLLGFNVGCLDTHNCRIHDIHPGAFRFNAKATAKNKRAKIDSYVTLTQGIGDSQFWWDTWCEFVAHQYETYAGDRQKVSGQHTECVCKDDVPF